MFQSLIRIQVDFNLVKIFDSDVLPVSIPNKDSS